MSMFIDPQDEHESNQRDSKWGNEDNFDKEMLKEFKIGQQQKAKFYEKVGPYHRIAIGRTGALCIIACLLTGAGTIAYAVLKGALIALAMIGL